MSVTITNTNTSQAPIISGKDIEIQCYQIAEQKDTEVMDAHILSVSTTDAPKSIEKTVPVEQKEEADGDYNPNDETESEPESEDVSSDNVSSDNEQSDQESSSEEENDEDDIVNSKEFQEEFEEAIENVLYVSKIDGKRILEKATQQYINETGHQPTEQEITDAFQTFTIDPNQASQAEESVSEAEEEVEVGESAFAQAIENVKQLGKIHQENFVNKLCNTFVEISGNEPSVEDLKNVFGMIKENFADEAREEFIEINDAEGDSDSDYKPTDKDLKTIEKDNQYDRKQKMEIVFVDDECDESESDESESDESESDCEEESENESESEYDYSGVEDAKEDVSDDNDDDYEPENDTFDYSQDIEDNKTFKTELNGTDENEIECDDQDTVDIQ